MNLILSGQFFIYILKTTTNSELHNLNSLLTGWHKEYPTENLFKPSAMLDKLVSEGKFGMKSGEGFYNHGSK